MHSGTLAMSDITEHKWFDEDLTSAFENNEFLVINVPTLPGDHIAFTNIDSIAIAKHFYSQLTTKQQKNAFLDDITSK